MGTRHVTMVVSKGKTKIAQYGQWDGYPSGQGTTALKFIRGVDLTKFVPQLDKCKFIDDEKQKEIDEFLISIGANNGWMTGEQAILFNDRYPLLTRDNGAEILSMVCGTDGDTIWLHDSTEFTAESLFCEWGYVIDLDKGTFEVYKGFNQTPVNENERFAYLNEKSDDEYYPIALLKTYSLDNLPTDDEFTDELDELTSEEDEDEVVNTIQDVVNAIDNNDQTASPTETIVVEGQVNDEDLEIEDGGCYKTFRVMVHPKQSDGMSLQINSWDDDGNHPEFDKLIGKKVRITVEIVD